MSIRRLLRGWRYPGTNQSRNYNQFLPNRDEKPEFVNKVFSNVAPKYDIMNDLMSLYIHRLWKDYFISRLKPMPGTQLIDVAGGTGDIAARFLKKCDINSKVTVCDINADMINEGQRRHPQSSQIEWVVGDALQLPFDDCSFDAYTIAYGIRNVADINLALEEAHRVLKPGGVFMCLEFSRVKNHLLRRPYERYLLDILPIMGEIVVGDYKSYRYLAESIIDFHEQEDFRQMISNAGFKYTSYENLMQGVSSIHYGYKKS